MVEIHPSSPTAALAVLGLSLLMDYAYPYHRGLLLKTHPVYTCFRLATRLAKPYGGRLYGVFLALACITIHLVPVLFALYIAGSLPSPWNTVFWTLVAAWVLKNSFSLRLLLEIGVRIYRHAVRRDWENARFWVQQIVRRNVYELDEKHILSAAIESLAESLVDGVVSPTFYYPFTGVLGPYIQRLINTLDGAVGFRTPQLRGVGWFSARLDSLVNYVPARLAALYIVISAVFLGYDWKGALRTYLRDRAKTESINAGHPMSAMAGALGIWLEKPGHYKLGAGGRAAEPQDVLRAVRILIVASLIHFTLLVCWIHFILCFSTLNL